MDDARPGKEIYMLNALWFNKDDGEEKYAKYMTALSPLLQNAGAELVNSLVQESVIVGDWDPDLVIVVRYPNLAAFQALTTSPEFNAIKPLREGALEKSQLIRCKASAF